MTNLQMLIGLGALGLNALVCGLTIRWHCQNDDRKFGEMMGRIAALERK